MSDSVGSVSVDVVPDARGWSEKLRAQIRDQTATVNVDADTGDAEAQIDETARNRRSTIKVDTDSRSSGILNDFVNKVSLLPALFIAAGAAAVPFAATLAGITAALAAPLAIAGGGATLFALLGGLAVKQTQAQLKSIDELQKKLAGLTKGTQEYADTSKELKAQQAALSPAQTAFATSLDHLKGVFAGFLGGANGQALLGPFTQGMDLLAKLLPVVSPLIRSVSSAFSVLLGDLSHDAGSRGFKSFVDQVSRLAGRDIRNFAPLLGHVVSGVGKLVVLFDKRAGGGLVKDLGDLTANFDHWAGSKQGRQDVRGFLEYFHRVGPQVGSTIGAVAHALGQVVKALAPLGPPVLKGIEIAANALSNIPVPVLTGIAAATAGLAVAGKVSQGVSKLTGGGGLLGGVTGGVLGGRAGVVPVYVTNPGFGGGPGGGGGGLTGLGKAIPVIGAAISAAIYSKHFADNERANNLSQYGTNDVVKIAQAKLAQQMQQAGYTRPIVSQKVGPFNFAVPAPSPHLTATTNAFDALKAHAQQAERQIDQIGPHAQASSAVAQHAVAALQNRIDSIHDKKFRIIADTSSAIHSMQALQAMRIADKHFTVYQRNQVIERVVGPGGGRGVTNPGGSGGGGGASGGGAGRPVHIHLDDNGRTTLTGRMQDEADQVYHANRGYESTAAGR